MRSGPVGFARSVEPIVPQEVTITRVAITTEADAEKEGNRDGTQIYRPLWALPLRGVHLRQSGPKTTGFSEEDLSLLWEVILNMFEHDHSAARGKMAVRDLIVFKHDSELGCAPAWKLFEAVHVDRKDPNDLAPARSYQDYTVSVDESALPSGVACVRMGWTCREEDLLPFRLRLFVFCRRQWALIRLKQQRQETLRTSDAYPPFYGSDSLC